MKISELPKEIKKRALQLQRDSGHKWNKTTDNLIDAFSWTDTKEGSIYWCEWHEKEPCEIQKKSLNLTKEQLEQIKDKIGVSELKKIIPEYEDEEIVFDESKIYIYKSKHGIYKLHTLNDDRFDFMNLNNSFSKAFIPSSFKEQMEHIKDKENLYIFNSYKEFIEWAYNKL